MSRKPSLPGADALFGGSPPKSTTKRSVKHVDKGKSPHVRKSTSEHVLKSTSTHVDKTPSKRPRKLKDEKPVRYTIYLMPEVLERLEEIWILLRRKHGKVPRWKIASLLLEEGLRDIGHVERLVAKS